MKCPDVDLDHLSLNLYYQTNLLVITGTAVPVFEFATNNIEWTGDQNICVWPQY